MKENFVVSKIIRCGLKVNNILGSGFPQEIYQRAFEVEMEDNQLKYDFKKSFTLKYKNEPIGEFKPDFVVKNEIIVQVCSVLSISWKEESKIKNYLRASKLKNGVILNFGPSFEFKQYEF